MNILQICNKSPFPPKEGGPIAMYNLAEGLIHAGHKVDVLAISTNKYFVDVDKLPSDYRDKTNFQAVFIDTSLRFTDAFLNLFSSKSYHVQRFDNEDMHKKLKEILQAKKYDIIQLETVYIGPYISTLRDNSDAAIVLRAHNIEHLIWKGIADNSKNPLKKGYLNLQVKKLKKFEQHVFNAVDGVACIAEADAEFIRKSGVSVPVTTIPFGMSVSEKIDEQRSSDKISFFHIGSMDWIPNQEGIKWFLDHCMPLIEASFPDNKVFLAGRNMPEWIYNYSYSNLEIVGEVQDASEFINSHDIMFVPLFSGSGVRIKIVEGMSQGKAIISTAIGAEGINYTDGKDIYIANSVEQFVEKFSLCINNSDKNSLIGNNAYALIKEHHNILNTTELLIEFYKSLVKFRN